ncbi:hypothetical protein QO002_000249 [Pararhizobium capsulatum DSM 1112]|uniref:Uncharacterized protein n=1 Tax=Pararhizobium capsulatum DSM 1112 TaxID=1121113 RepID=A0ABU0BKA0_9HYPH|nr:hypothetical protein [Pararhizobium capsulatum DSM 1112]
MVPGPSGESFYGALVMSVPPANKPADYAQMTIYSMPPAHALGMCPFCTYADQPISNLMEVWP